MTLERLSSIALVGVLLLLAGIAFGGCGGESEGKPSQSYEEVIKGLRSAAQTNGTYHAMRRANEFPPGEREVLRSFCEFAWQIVQNLEFGKLPITGYADSRVRRRSFVEGNASFDEISAAMSKIRSAIDFSKLEEEKLKRYRRACYH